MLAKVKDWARSVPEIHIGGEQRNPVIRVQLSDVDYESVVERARGEDNEGRRRELIKELVRDALGRKRGPCGRDSVRHAHAWSGAARAREVDLVFGNVRDTSWLTDDHFRARPGTWRFVVDHPFDEHGHTAAEDLARLDQLLMQPAPRPPWCGCPGSCPRTGMRELSRLVMLDWLLTGPGERWTSHADHLPEVDRVAGAGDPGITAATLREQLAASCRRATARPGRCPGTLQRTRLTTGC